MGIWRKNVTAAGEAGRIMVPKALVGETIWVVSQKDVDDLQELITTTLLYRKTYQYQQAEFLEEFAKFKKDMELRVNRIENIIVTH